MTLIEMFNSDARMRSIVEKIMRRPSRLKYKRLDLLTTLRAYTSQVDAISMREVRALHYALHPNDSRKKSVEVAKVFSA